MVTFMPRLPRSSLANIRENRKSYTYPFELRYSQSSVRSARLFTAMGSSDNSVRRNLIWLADVDASGRRLHPEIQKIVYAKQSELARYRSDELGDDAQAATLIEEAAYRASEVAYSQKLDDPASYLFRTYRNLVDRTLRKTIRSFALEEQVLSHLA